MIHKTRAMLAVLTLLTLLAIPPALAADTETYKVDNGHSTLIFRVRHFGAGAVYGRFRTLTGEIAVDKKNPAKSRVKVAIDAASVYTADKKRDAHLANPDFLDAKQFPKITFASSKVKKTGKGYSVTGKLSLHGVTKTVTIPVVHLGEGKDAWGGYRIGFESKFSIKRGDYGITKMPGAVGERIDLILAIEGIRN